MKVLYILSNVTKRAQLSWQGVVSALHHVLFFMNGT